MDYLTLGYPQETVAKIVSMSNNSLTVSSLINVSLHFWCKYRKSDRFRTFCDRHNNLHTIWFTVISILMTVLGRSSHGQYAKFLQFTRGEAKGTFERMVA